MSTGPAAWAWGVLAGALREAARNGLPEDPARRALVDTLRAAAAAEAVQAEQACRSVIGPIRAGHAVEGVSTKDIPALSGHAPPITTVELASALRVSPRHALRRARRAGITSRTAGRAHLWPPDAAEQLATTEPVERTRR